MYNGADWYLAWRIGIEIAAYAFGKRQYKHPSVSSSKPGISASAAAALRACLQRSMAA